MGRLLKPQTDDKVTCGRVQDKIHQAGAKPGALTQSHQSKSNNRFRDFVSVVCNQPLLSKHEEVRLCKLATAGNKQAREKLLRSNLRYVVKLAYKFTGYLNDKSQVEDLFNEGFKGLMQAIDRFEYRKDNRFITYAYWWVLKSMRTYVEREKRRSFSDWKRLEDPMGNGSEDVVIGDFLIDHDIDCPERIFQQEVLRETMQDILKNPCFSAKERLCLELTYYHNKTANEIAESDGIKENTVKSHLFRAKKKLARILEENSAIKETFMATV